MRVYFLSIRCRNILWARIGVVSVLAHRVRIKAALVVRLVWLPGVVLVICCITILLVVTSLLLLGIRVSVVRHWKLMEDVRNDKKQNYCGTRIIAVQLHSFEVEQ
jgi:hypothetical protein